MNSRERVLAALNHTEPDMVPVCEFTINRSIRHKICETCEYGEFIEHIDLDAAVIVPTLNGMQKIGQDTYRDPWHTIYQDTGENSLIETDFPITSKDDLVHYTPPDPVHDYRLHELHRIVQQFKQHKAIIFTISDAFSRPRKLMGMETLLMNYITSPEFVHDVVAISVEYNLKLLEKAIAAGAEIIFSADDYAGTYGPFMSPKHFREYIAPGLTTLVKRTHELGAKYIKHSDGDLWPVLEMLVNTGIDGLHPIDPSAGMDIYDVKQKYGDKICMIGNVDCQYTLCDGTTEEVITEVKNLITRLAPGGSYMLASSNSIHNGVNPQNFLTMIAAAREYGKYPIHSRCQR